MKFTAAVALLVLSSTLASGTSSDETTSDKSGKQSLRASQFGVTTLESFDLDADQSSLSELLSSIEDDYRVSNHQLDRPRPIVPHAAYTDKVLQQIKELAENDEAATLRHMPDSLADDIKQRREAAVKRRYYRNRVGEEIVQHPVKYQILNQRRELVEALNQNDGQKQATVPLDELPYGLADDIRKRRVDGQNRQYYKNRVLQQIVQVPHEDQINEVRAQAFEEMNQLYDLQSTEDSVDELPTSNVVKKFKPMRASVDNMPNGLREDLKQRRLAGLQRRYYRNRVGEEIVQHPVKDEISKNRHDLVEALHQNAGRKQATVSLNQLPDNIATDIRIRRLRNVNNRKAKLNRIIKGLYVKDGHVIPSNVRKMENEGLTANENLKKVMEDIKKF